MDTGDKIKTKLGAFSFGGTTPKKFDDHVSQCLCIQWVRVNL